MVIAACVAASARAQRAARSKRASANLQAELVSRTLLSGNMMLILVELERVLYVLAYILPVEAHRLRRVHRSQDCCRARK